jgi:hypothetical protein
MMQDAGRLTRYRNSVLIAVICLWGVQAMAADGLTTLRSSHGPKSCRRKAMEQQDDRCIGGTGFPIEQKFKKFERSRWRPSATLEIYRPSTGRGKWAAGHPDNAWRPRPVPRLIQYWPIKRCTGRNLELRQRDSQGSLAGEQLAIVDRDLFEAVAQRAAVVGVGRAKIQATRKVLRLVQPASETFKASGSFCW